MRLWSIHPKHLDQKGLTALWREALLAKAVLDGKTKGYKNHPQLARFKAHPAPLIAINTYLYFVWEEAKRRGYNFNSSKFDKTLTSQKITVTDKQLDYEWLHLMKKLKVRDPSLYEDHQHIQNYLTHPLFNLVKGSIAEWEKIHLSI